MNASKETISGDDVWAVLSSAPKIYVANGKKIIEYSPAEAEKDEVMKKVTGRTGNLRAPSLRIGDTYYIGFNQDLYDKIQQL